MYKIYNNSRRYCKHEGTLIVLKILLQSDNLDILVSENLYTYNDTNLQFNN